LRKGGALEPEIAFRPCSPGLLMQDFKPAWAGGGSIWRPIAKTAMQALRRRNGREDQFRCCGRSSSRPRGDREFLSGTTRRRQEKARTRRGNNKQESGALTKFLKWGPERRFFELRAAGGVPPAPASAPHQVNLEYLGADGLWTRKQEMTFGKKDPPPSSRPNPDARGRNRFALPQW